MHPNGVALVTLSRPHVMNALDIQLRTALIELAMQCDILIASEKVTFGLPEVTLGEQAQALRGLGLRIAAVACRNATMTGLPFA